MAALPTTCRVVPDRGYGRLLIGTIELHSLRQNRTFGDARAPVGLASAEAKKPWSQGSGMREKRTLLRVTLQGRAALGC